MNYASSVAKPGDVIIVRNGHYSGWQVNIKSTGGSANPVIYTSQTPGHVTFSGSTRFIISGDFNVVGGFVFSALTQHNAVMIRKGTDNRLTDNRFEDCGGKPNFNIVGLIDGANRNRFDHNTMIGNRAVGIAVVLPRDGDTSFAYSKDNRIDHNTFRDIPIAASVQYAMALQVGQYATQHTADETRTIVDNNIFDNIGPETINSKSNSESYIYNVFKNSTSNTVLSLRSGDNKYLEGNRFENVKIAVHAYGQGHTIVNNMFIDVTDIALLIPRWGEYTIRSTGKTSFSPPTGEMDIAYNTFANATRKTVELGRTWGYNKPGYKRANIPPSDLRLYNNIFSSSTGILIHDRGTINTDINNNIFHTEGNSRYGNLGSNPLVGDPRLDARLHPSDSSIAVDSADATLYLDIDAAGSARTTPDIGALEAL